MFTGIIETMATIADIRHEGTNVHFYIDCSITPQLKVDQSVAHNGVCLTVVEIKKSIYKVTAVAETMAKTNLAHWKMGDRVNIERALKLGERLGGHFSQGYL